jgi:hypothetical protein
MRAKILALTVGAAMLAGAGTAYADAVVPAGTKAATPAAAESQMKTVPEMKAAGQERRPLVLTETQMDKITAGLGGPSSGGWAFASVKKDDDIKN